MKVIKRDGTEVPFNTDKIMAALMAAVRDAPDGERIPEEEIQSIAGRVGLRCRELERSASVEEIQDMVVDELEKAIIGEVEGVLFVVFTMEEGPDWTATRIISARAADEDEVKAYFDEKYGN